MRPCRSPVAMRSSALDEDGITASFAGQYETVLNVSGVYAVVKAVVGCWVSATSARVAAYRRQKQVLHDHPYVPVLVQQMVGADIAAVAFSVNPVTHDRGEVVINASWGLGESLVDGSVTPDMYVVRRADLRVVQQSIGTKRRMSVPITGDLRH